MVRGLGVGWGGWGCVDEVRGFVVCDEGVLGEVKCRLG